MESNIPVHLKMDWNLFFTEALYETITFPVHRKLSSPLESELECFFEGSVTRNPTFQFAHPLGSYNGTHGPNGNPSPCPHERQMSTTNQDLPGPKR